jgi:surface antigen
MFRVALLALPLLAAPVALPVPVAAASVAAEQSRTGERCDEQQSERRRSRGRGIGGFLGSAVGGRLGGIGSVVNSVAPVGQLLGEAIASLLDCREQRQAATATEEAVRGPVGTTASWRSETRSNVSGSSTVTAAEPVTASAEECVTVTDIVIIEGEETRAPKRMCRRPPNNRFVRA